MVTADASSCGSAVTAHAGSPRDEGDPEATVPTADRLPLVRLDGLRVLVVDDEADSRRVLVMVLERVGAIVTAASSVLGAIEVVPKTRPDVLVSDLGMPDQTASTSFGNCAPMGMTRRICQPSH